MDLVVATVSGYHGSQRFNLIKLISHSGASYVGAMNSSTTHLVCYKFEGNKYELANKFNTIVVNHRWIEECVKQGRRVSERPYMKHCGYEVGPLLLEIPNAGGEVRRVLGEVSATRNVSKTPVIDIECDDDEWTDSWLLKENQLPDTRQTKDRSNRLKRIGTKRCSKQDDLLTNNYCLEESPSSGLKRIEKRKLTTGGEPPIRNPRLIHNYGKRRNLILEEIEDLGTTSDHQDHSARVVHDDCNKMEDNPKLSKEVFLSCVICWTDFSSTRGVLPCGHRFCFSCIQNWADHMASMKKVSTCPLCKASFYSIQKMEDAESSDQKIYSQTIPNNRPVMDVYILPHCESSIYQNLPPPTPVCYQCSCREPEELLISCHSCQIRCVHSYCLDPPQIPWVCVQCKDLRMRYAR